MCTCCGYLTQTVTLETLLQVALSNRRFCGQCVGQPSFFALFRYIILSVLSKFSNINQISIKNEAKWYPTCSCSYLWEQSFKGLDSPWTDSQCFFCMKVMSTFINFLNGIATNRWGIVLWWCQLTFDQYFFCFKAEFHKFLSLFQKEITLFTVLHPEYSILFLFYLRHLVSNKNYYSNTSVCKSRKSWTRQDF